MIFEGQNSPTRGVVDFISIHQEPVRKGQLIFRLTALGAETEEPGRVRCDSCSGPMARSDDRFLSPEVLHRPGRCPQSENTLDIRYRSLHPRCGGGRIDEIGKSVVPSHVFL